MISKPAHEIEVKVPYGDIDWLGHVNNAKYLTYFETARAELMWKTFGKEERKKWLDVIIARAEIDYRAPAKWNDVLIVKVRPVSIGNSSWIYEYEIELKEDKRGRGKIIAQGKTVQVAYDYESKKSVPIPSNFRELLMQQIEETTDN
jgi:acyl-CoA thioester hydrolase